MVMMLKEGQAEVAVEEEDEVLVLIAEEGVVKANNVALAGNENHSMLQEI